MEPRETILTKMDIPYFETSHKLFGYFQNEKYFKKYKNEFLELLTIDDKTHNYIINK